MLFAQVGILTLRQLHPDPALIGQFGIAMQFLTTLLIVPATMGSTILPALGRIRRRGAAGEIAALSLVVRGGLVASGGIAILAAAYVPWLVSLLLGPRYAAAGETFALLAWGLGPYAVALAVGQALNGLGGRVPAAGLAVTMVVLHVAVMVALVRSGAFAALDAAVVSLLVGALAGCVIGALALGPRIGAAGIGWWLRPLALIAVAGLAMHWEPVPNLWAAPAYLAIFAGLSWSLGIVTRDDFRFVVSRLGIR
jgi:O-antigen/teichoic acid export membrane protein